MVSKVYSATDTYYLFLSNDIRFEVKKDERYNGGFTYTVFGEKDEYRHNLIFKSGYLNRYLCGESLSLDIGWIDYNVKTCTLNLHDRRTNSTIGQIKVQSYVPTKKGGCKEYLARNEV